MMWICLGECDCKDGFLKFFDKSNQLSCYKEYFQGPCNEDHRLVQISTNENETEEHINPECVPTKVWTNYRK